MKIIDILSPDSILENMESQNKFEVLKNMSFHLGKLYPSINSDELLAILLEREKLGSTGLEEGVAIPHGKLKNIDHLIALFGRSIQGVNFEALDDKPAHLFFLLVAPENSAGSHLKALARVTRMLKDASFRNKLLKAQSQEEIYTIITQEDAKLK